MSELDDKLVDIKRIVQTWVDKQGHDRCWYYPDLFNELVRVLEITPSRDPCLPPLGEFREGCKRYQKEQYGDVSS